MSDIEEDLNQLPDPDETPIRDRKVITQNWDSVVSTLVEQIKGNTIFLKPLSDRPDFQRNYVWSNELASRLIESILLNVPIPPVYLSQNEDFELDVIDGQQRLYSVFRFLDNQLSLTGLRVLTELNGNRFHQLSTKLQRQLETHTMRCVVITNQSHHEIKFDVFERLNSNTVPLNAQELRNCVYRGALNTFLGEEVGKPIWLSILNKRTPDKRLRDEELILRFVAFQELGLESYKTPLKQWLNDIAQNGRKFKPEKIEEIRNKWRLALNNSLSWFKPSECFRRPEKRPLNKVIFDLVTFQALKYNENQALEVKREFLQRFHNLFDNAEFLENSTGSIDHVRKTKNRFRIWEEVMTGI